MDVFEKAQQTRPHIEGADENLTAARARLMAEIQAERKPIAARASRRPWIIAGGLVGAAAAVTAGVLVVNALSVPTSKVEAIPTKEPVPSSEPVPTQEPVPTPTAEPTEEPLTASRALQGAARAAAVAPILVPGQYLRIDAAQELLVNYEPVEGSNDLAVNRMNAESAWLIGSRRSHYIPAVLRDEWVVENHLPWTIAAVFGVDAQTRSEQWLAAASPSYIDVQRDPGGLNAWWVGSWASQVADSSYAALLESLPDDPDALIEWLRRYVEDPAKHGWILARLLSDNVGTPAQRAAMYDALSTLPGTELLSSDERHATIQLWTDGFDPAQPLFDYWRTVTIDRATGFVTEYTERHGTNPALVPDSLPDIRITYEVSVADSAP